MKAAVLVIFALASVSAFADNKQSTFNVEIQNPTELSIAACINGLSREAELAEKTALTNLPTCDGGLLGHVSVDFTEINTEGASALCIAGATRDCQ